MTLEVIAALAAFVWVFKPSSHVFFSRKEDTAAQALEISVEEDGETRALRLSLPLTIGRSADATLVLKDVRVSRMHARIDPEKEQGNVKLVLQDLGSRNGTLLHGCALHARGNVRKGDVIEIGSARIVVGELVSWI
jgi:pSer/pThr/pTyr-binding forkhead associated (FHA) protein